MPLISSLREVRPSNSRTKIATWWGFYTALDNDLYAWLICDPPANKVEAKDKREKKGLLRYTNATGSTSLRRHVEDHHKTAHANALKRLAEKGSLIASEPRKEKVKSSSTLDNLLVAHKKYSETSISQIRHNRDLVLLIAKSALPLSIVENMYFRSYVHIYNPRIKMPSRRKLSSELIPEFIKDVFEKFVTPKIAQMDTDSTTFDLWMSKGCEGIFDLILHGIDKNFKKHQLHLRMLECGSTRGVDLAGVLKPELEKHGLLHKLLACVKDGGSNLRTCTSVLRTVTDCRPMGIEHCF